MGIRLQMIESPGRVELEWCAGDRCVRRDVTGLWTPETFPAKFEAIQAGVLAELAGEVPAPRIEGGAPVGEVQTCKVCLRRHRGNDYMYCSDRCRARAGVAVGDHRGGRWARK